MRFAEPLYLFALPLLLVMIYLYNKRHKIWAIRFSGNVDLGRFENQSEKWLLLNLPFIFRALAMFLIIVALARPQTGYNEREITSKGIDIMLTLDLSSSMSATDLRPNRLAAAKKVLKEFIAGRTNDRIGLVVFSAEGFTQCPMTIDYPVLADFVDKSYIGLIDDGTAIGMAIATATARLRKSTAKSRIIILLTDGVNNAGAIDPLTASSLAKAIGVKIYTIGVGREGIFRQMVTGASGISMPRQVQTEIDEKLLKQIADSTGGRFFRARDEGALAKIYKEIDRLEKTDLKMKIYARYTDYFGVAIGLALFFLTLEFIWPMTPFRILP